MKYIKILSNLNFLKEIGIMFTSLYVWIGSSYYLYFNVSNFSGNVSFYGGFFVIIIILIISVVEFLGGKK